MLIGCTKGKEESCKCGMIMGEQYTFCDPDRNWEQVTPVVNNCSGNDTIVTVKYLMDLGLNVTYRGDYVCFSKSW